MQGGGWNANQGQKQQMKPNQGQGQGQGNNQGAGFDFNRISEMPSKYPREEIPENLEENMELGGTYQEFVYKLGDCCGCIRIVCPCCCCVDYPYQQIDQSYIGTVLLKFRNLWTFWTLR